MSPGKFADLSSPPRSLGPIGPSTGNGAHGRDDDFDCLADLFLGEVGDASGRGAEPTSAGAVATVAPTVRPSLRLAGAEEPLNVGEPLGAHVDARETPAVASPSSALVECVMLGHLPVLAAAWASQYVRDIATAAGRPVAVLRLQAGYATIELVSPKAGANGDSMRGGLGHDELGEAGNGHPAATLEHAMQLAAAATDRWIVRVDPGDEAELAAGKLVRIVTLLTGADEAARVGAYRAIKSLSQRLPSPAARSNGAPQPIIRLAVMSAPSARATEVGEKLAEAARTFLGRTVERASCSPTINSSQAPLLLYSGRTDVQTPVVMEMLGRVLASTPVVAARTMAAAPVRERTRPVASPVVAAAPRDPEPRFDEEMLVEAVGGFGISGPGLDEIVPLPRGPEVVGRTAPAKTNETEREIETPASRVSTRKEEPTQDADVEELGANESSVSAEIESLPGALAMHLPELRPISLRCPYAPGVEFAVDPAGALHMLNLITADVSAEGAVSELLVGAAWADAHSELLGARAGGRVMHLFTDRPRDSRRLQETNIRVHLLARVGVEGRTAWFCADLN